VAGGGGKQRADAPDLSEAVDWVRRAAEGGLGLAMSRLATVLRNGKGVLRDDAAASLWYRQAINASNEPAAHCRLGQMLWERTAFPTTPHRTALEEATAHLSE